MLLPSQWYCRGILKPYARACMTTLFATLLKASDIVFFKVDSLAFSLD